MSLKKLILKCISVMVTKDDNSRGRTASFIKKNNPRFMCIKLN